MTRSERIDYWCERDNGDDGLLECLYCHEEKPDDDESQALGYDNHFYEVIIDDPIIGKSRVVSKCKDRLKVIDLCD